MPKAVRTLPPAEYLHQCFTYDAESGELRWRDWHVARIIYKLRYTVEPEYVDHKDRNPRNNRIDNLRTATKQQNGRNAFHPIGASGFTGVRPKRGRFVANIQGLAGKNIFLGSFTSAEEAHAVYREASVRIFGEFSPFHVT